MSAFEGSAGKAFRSAVPAEAGDGELRNKRNTRVIDVSKAVEALDDGHNGIRASQQKEVVESMAWLKCIYTNARSMDNKQEELEAIVRQKNYNVVAITETCWDDSHNWSAALDGYKLFRGTGEEGEEVG
ncbi:hypothetical protein AV530_006205 [Patagioenas fasciata monilis]|uniref:Uncharacterized protein n=1 Tax=Patagioenas fasciata monilis TaxID=372326 RepID=A0A1V4KT25_PATFA|nr:hypothetical protein AV530_006205 [Patagioenas fasciata monilis]